jgi:hypothetical protein
MVATRKLLAALMGGLVAGWAVCGIAMASDVGGATAVTRKVYDLLGLPPAKPGDPPNSLLTPQTIVLDDDFQGKDDQLSALQRAFRKHRAEHRLDDVIVCVRAGDEAEGARRLADLVHARFPGVRVALTGAFPAEALQRRVDVYVPADAQLTDAELKACEGVQRVRDCIEAVRQRKHQRRYTALIGEGRKLLAACKGVVPDLEHPLVQPAKLDDLLARFVPLAEPYEKWDRGAMSLGRAIEVRIARQTARRRKALRERHVSACEVLKAEPLSQDDWNALWPKRVLFSQDFEGPPTKAHDWDGKIVTDNVPKGSRRALAGRPGNKYFARRTRTGIYYDNARSTTTTWVTFHYFINKQMPIGVFVFSMTQMDNCRYRIPKPVVGRWTEVTIQVGGGKARIRSGEALDDVFIHAGKPGDKDLVLIVDNVRLIGLD